MSLFKLEESHPLEKLALARSVMSAVDMGWDVCPTISADFYFLLVGRIYNAVSKFFIKKKILLIHFFCKEEVSVKSNS